MSIATRVSTKHKLLALPYSQGLANLFKDAQQVDIEGKPWLAVKHDPSTTFILRKMGYNVASPIMHHTFPGMQKPFKTQLDTVSHLIMNRKAYVLNEMGTGKTKSALWAWDYLYSLGLTGKLIIFAPLSTLHVVWAAEIMATIPNRTWAILHGTRSKRIKELDRRDVDIYIINHDGHKIVNEQLKRRTDINHVVIDELAIYRNSGSPRSKLIADYCHTLDWVWGMTGSPIPTSPCDVYAQAKIVTPHTVPSYFKYFRDEVMFKIGDFRWVPKSNAVEKAFEALQPAVRYTLSDVMELPETVIRYLDVPMGPKQRLLYEDLFKTAHSLYEQHIITAANAGGIMSKLMQIAAGWVYSTQGGVAALDNSPRITALVDAIEGCSNKILVFATFKHATAGIAAALKHAGYNKDGATDFTVVTGDTPASERNEVFTLFQQTDKYRILVAHPQCLAHGINLTRADTICWFNPTTNLEIYDQANQRIRRVGQKNKQLILHFQGAPVEKHVYKLLGNKQGTQISLLDMFKEATQ
jgi:SNF2 family DNA or RNA helicase